MATWDGYNKQVSKTSVAPVKKPVATGWDAFNAQFSGTSRANEQRAKIASLSTEADQATIEAEKAQRGVDIGEKIIDAPVNLFRKIGAGIGTAFEAVQKAPSVITRVGLESVPRVKRTPISKIYEEAPTISELTTVAGTEYLQGKPTKIINVPFIGEVPYQYWLNEFVGQLGEAGVLAFGGAAIGSELATNAKTIKITPDHFMPENVIAKKSGGMVEPVPESVVKMVDRILQDAPPEVVNQIKTKGLEIKVQAPAGGARQLVGEEILGGRAGGQRLEVKIPGFEKTGPVEGSVPSRPVTWEEYNKQASNIPEPQKTNIQGLGTIDFEKGKFIPEPDVPNIPPSIPPVRQTESPAVNEIAPNAPSAPPAPIAPIEQKNYSTPLDAWKKGDKVEMYRKSDGNVETVEFVSDHGDGIIAIEPQTGIPMLYKDTGFNYAKSPTPEQSQARRSLLGDIGQTVIKKEKPVLSREEYLKNQIDKKIDEFRRSAGIMPTTQGAGVRYRKVLDAVGNVNFVASDFKLAKAKKHMANQSKDSKQYAEETLYENDPQFKDTLDEYNQIIEQKQPNKPMIDNWDEPVFKRIGKNVLASTGKKQSIEKLIEQRNVEQGKQGFILSEKAKQILSDLGIPIAEKTLSSKYQGIYKPLSKNVRVQAMHDLTTVVHEAVHAIDNKTGITKRLIRVVGETKDGNPIYDKATAPIRKLLTDIYEESYGYTVDDLVARGMTTEQAMERLEVKRTHRLSTRMKEGLSTFIENYFYNPAGMEEKYPVLVAEFIKKDGEYHSQDIEQLLTKMNELVDDYAKLSPDERIGARIRRGDEVVKQESGFNVAQRAIFEVFNRFEPLKRYARKAGVEATWDDPTVQAFNLLNKNNFVANFITGEKIPIIQKDGNFTYQKGNVEDYVKLVSGKEKEFDTYLVARRVIANHNKLQLAKDEFLKIKDDYAELLRMRKDGYFVDPKKLEEYKQILENYKRWKSIIEKDDFRLQDATATVEKYAEEFKPAEKIYDEINKSLIDWSENTGLLKSDKANEYRADEGYSSWKRYIDDEIASGAVGTRTGSKGKISSFKERTGSDLDIISPIYNQIVAINEVVGKGLENLLWGRIYNLSKKSPEIAQRFESIEATPAVDKDGNISWPQERDPSILRIFVDGERMFFKPAPEFVAIMKTLKPNEFTPFDLILGLPASLFTRLTTSANPIWSLGNITIDQFSALAQTKTGFKPIIDPAKSFVDYVKGDELMKDFIALGGKRQTLASFYRISPEEIPIKLLKKIGQASLPIHKKVLNAPGKILDAGLDVLETPANLSEIMTRFSEFRRAKEMGKNDSEAMFAASQITVPFQLQGNFYGAGGRKFIKSIPYFNAVLQVLYKFASTAKTNPIRMATVGVGIFTAALTTAIVTMVIASEEQKRLLSEQPARLLARYIYFPSPNGKDLIRLRIPEQFGALSGMAYLWAISHYTGNEAKFSEYADSMMSFVPDQLDITEPKKMILSWMPQTIKPSVMAITNTKTYPEIRPIIPDYMKYKEPSERYTTYTSRVAKMIGKLLNASPAIIDFWIREQFGAVGGAVLGKLPAVPLYLQEKDYVLTGRAYNNFYDQRDLVDYQYNLVKDQKGSFSDKEQLDIRTRYKLNNEVAETLGELRKLAQKNNFELPEKLKATSFELLSNIDKNSVNQSYEILMKLRNDLYRSK